MVVVVAHGFRDENTHSEVLAASSGPESILNDFHVLASVFPSLSQNHKVLVICEGLNSDSLAALNVGQPGAEVAADAFMIANQLEVTAADAIGVCAALFADLATRSQGRRPTGRELRASFETAVQPRYDGWHAAEALQIEEEID